MKACVNVLMYICRCVYTIQSLMPGMLCVLSMREGLVVRKSSRMFLPLVGSRTAW